MGVDTSGLELLSRADCVRLLSSTGIGRIGFHAAALPVILPVAYAMDADSIVVRVRDGSQLAAATRDAVVAFEADDVNGQGGGWSVAVTGVASPVRDPAAQARADRLLVRQWGGDGDRYIRISLDLLSGRRRTLPGAAAPSSPEPPEPPELPEHPERLERTQP